MNRRNAGLLTFAVVLVAATTPRAQDGEIGDARTRIDFEADLPSLADVDAVRNWVDSELRQQLGLGEADQLLVDEQSDTVGDYTVFRLSQTAHDLPVVYRESRLLLNSENEPVHLLGHHSSFPDIPSDQPQLSSQDAFAVAGGSASALSSSRLVYWPSADGLRLAYELEGRFTGPELPTAIDERVYVDAINGEVLQRLPLIHEAVDRRVYDFSQACRDIGIRTQMNASTALAVLRESPLVRSESQSGNHRNAERLFELLGDYHTFLAVILGIDSIDGEGKPLVGYIGARFLPQTGYLPQCIGDAFQAVWHPGDYAVLPDEALDFPELIGHEFTHGLISHGSGLVYLHRPGALNESISDVVGATFSGWRENLAPLTPDADIAMSPRHWQLHDPLGVVRDMQDPQSVRLPDGTTLPDHYDDYRYLPEDVDSGGVHVNSSILNLGFHLLAEGGQHPRRRGGPTVEAIGAMRAVRIFAAAAAWILQPSSDFEDARYAFAYAAEAFHGPASTEWVAVHTAMDAVGIPGYWEPQPEPKLPEPETTAPEHTGTTVESEVATPAETVPSPEPPPEIEPPPTQLPPASPPQPLRDDEMPSTQTVILVLLAVAAIITAVVVAYTSRPGKRVPNRARSVLGAQPHEHNAKPSSPSTPLVGSLHPLDESNAIPLAQAQLASTEGLVIGRAKSICHVELRDPAVSRRHVRLRIIEGAVFVEDLNSLRGTSIAGKILKPFHPERLAARQTLGIAELQFQFQVSQ